MDLTVYDVIQGPIISDKAYRLNQDHKKLVLKIHPQANKPLVKEALEKLFNVKVKKIGIVTRKGKNRMSGRFKVTSPGMKKAVITLAEGYSIDLFSQSATGVGIPAVVKKSENVKRSSDQSKD